MQEREIQVLDFKHRFIEGPYSKEKVLRGPKFNAGHKTNKKHLN